MELSYGPDKLGYDSLKKLKLERVNNPEFDDKLHIKNDPWLENKIIAFYNKLNTEAIVPSQLFLDANTLGSSLENKVYIERRLLEIAEDFKDKIVYIRLIHEADNPQECLIGKIYLARSSKI